MTFLFFNDTPTTEIYTLSLHDALPISGGGRRRVPPDAAHVGRQGTMHLALDIRRPYAEPSGAPGAGDRDIRARPAEDRSEEHTSELQSRLHLVCRLLLEKKKKIKTKRQ